MTARRILLIDDDIGLCQLVAISLRTIASWEPLIANSGTEGLALAAAEQPDAILLDWMMPDLPGSGVLTQLQANASTASIPVILLTAKAKNTQEQLAELPVTGIITKPFRASDLVVSIRTLLNWDD